MTFQIRWPVIRRSMRCQPGSLGGHVVRQDGSGWSRQGHRHLVTTFTHDPTKPEVGSNISYVQRSHFTASKPSIGHEGEDRALPETAQP